MVHSIVLVSCRFWAICKQQINFCESNLAELNRPTCYQWNTKEATLPMLGGG